VLEKPPNEAYAGEQEHVKERIEQKVMSRRFHRISE